MGHRAQSMEVRTSVDNLYVDLCSRHPGFGCVHIASKQAHVARSFSNLNLGLHVGQFDVGLKGITARAMAIKLHSLCLHEAQRYCAMRRTLTFYITARPPSAIQTDGKSNKRTSGRPLTVAFLVL